MLQTLMALARREPAIITGSVTAIIAVLIAFGVPITPQEKVAIGGVAVPLLMIVGAVVTRQNVTPNVKLSTSPKA